MADEKKIENTVPDIEQALQISDDIVRGVFEQSSGGNNIEMFDTATLAHLAAAVRLFILRGSAVEGIHVVVTGLAGMLVEDKDGVLRDSEKVSTH